MTHPALSSLNPFINPDPDRGYMGQRLIPALGTSVATSACGVTAGETATFQPDLAALAVWLDEPPLFLRTRPTIRYADESRDLLAWFKVFFD